MKRKISNGVLFLIGVFLVYVLIALFDSNFALEAIYGTLGMLLKILPLLLFVFFLMFLINIYLSSGRLQKHLGRESGIRGWVYAVVSGILISGPPYILYPLLGDLKKKGVKNSLMAVFLYNRNVKIPFIPVMIFYFGFSFTIILSFYLILFSVFNGLVVGALTKEEGVG